MRLTPPPPAIGERDGFTEENDLFGLSEFGERLANRVCSLDEPLVLVLDGPWGSGKSTFMRQWAGLLRQRGVPTIVFDAFANDHQEDAFIALASEVAALAEATVEKDEGLLAEYKEKAKKVGRVLLPLAVKASVRAATLGVLSAEDLEDVKEFLAPSASDLGAVAEQLVEERLTRAQADRDALEAFRSSLEGLARSLAEAESSKVSESAGDDSGAKQSDDTEAGPAGPLVFIIDELDRCRPPFALNLLERVKHLFSVNGVCFVLVAHLHQLESVISGAYGPDLDSRTYLEKFYALRIILPESKKPNENRRERYISYLWDGMGLDSGEHDYDAAIRRGLLMLAGAYGLQLRTLERMAALMALVYAATTIQILRVGALVVGLCVMRLIKPDLYAKAKDANLTWKEAHDFLRLHTWDKKETAEWVEHWWRYATDEALPEELWVDQCGQLLERYGIWDRQELLPFITNLIDELHQRDEQRTDPT